MPEPQPLYDPSPADGRFQREILLLRWTLVTLYAVFVQTGILSVTPVWFFVSEGVLVVHHVCYTWYVWRELTHQPLPEKAAYAIPFVDTLGVTLTLIAVGDPVHPIWGLYLSIIVGVAYFYYAVSRQYAVWLTGNYLMVGLGVSLRGLEVPYPSMLVALIVLLASMASLAAYTSGERRLRRRIFDAARIDPLTNLRNRRGLEEALSSDLEASQEGKGSAVLMIDVDHFKRYNDQFGHLAADEVLEQLGEILASAVRDPDLVARYGGDEFVAIFQHVTPHEAAQLAERLRHQTARMGLCTVSIGVGASDGLASMKELLDRADAAVFQTTVAPECPARIIVTVATAQSTARFAEPKATMKLSPTVFTSCPLCCSIC